ncbi:MAG: amidohydrolase family protein [Thermoplasmata archaeon]|nr:amidohydrolase family protein [Thermoplasmata archaeon]
MDLVVEARVFFNGQLIDACVGIEEGRIAAVKKTIKGGEKRIERPGSILLPGGVDTHVHMREPGQSYKEDFYTGSTAAACGGTTFFLDMPNNISPLITRAALEEKTALASKSVTDCGFLAMLHPDTEPGVMSGVMGLKWYHSSTTGTEGWPDTGAALEKLHILTSTPESPSTLLVSIHAEKHTAPETSGSPSAIPDLRAYSVMRPASSEVAALEEIAGELERESEKENIQEGRPGVVFNAAHCSSPPVVEAARNGRFKVEVALHHLFLHNALPLGPWGKVNPPLRGKDDVAGLWSLLAEGKIDVLATDHAPHTREEKEAGTGDLGNAPAGLPGVEARLPLMLAAVKRGRLPLPLMVRITAENPGRLLRLPKGEIRVGYDGDLALYDLSRIGKIKAGDTHSKCGWTPYEGMEAVFPTHVLRRGELIAEAGDRGMADGWVHGPGGGRIYTPVSQRSPGGGFI